MTATLCSVISTIVAVMQSDIRLAVVSCSAVITRMLSSKDELIDNSIGGSGQQ